MAEYATRTKTLVTREVVLPSPTNWAEVSKAFAYCQQELTRLGKSQADDQVQVKAWDDEIVIWFVLSDETE